jgi:uncharacterized protein (DUF305 family)
MKNKDAPCKSCKSPQWRHGYCRNHHPTASIAVCKLLIQHHKKALKEAKEKLKEAKAALNKARNEWYSVGGC